MHPESKVARQYQVVYRQTIHIHYVYYSFSFPFSIDHALASSTRNISLRTEHSQN